MSSLTRVCIVPSDGHITDEMHVAQIHSPPAISCLIGLGRGKKVSIQSIKPVIYLWALSRLFIEHIEASYKQWMLKWSLVQCIKLSQNKPSENYFQINFVTPTAKKNNVEWKLKKPTLEICLSKLDLHVVHVYTCIICYI